MDIDIKHLLKAKLKGEIKLETPVRRRPLTAEIHADEIVFIIGKRKSRRKVSWDSLVKIIKFLWDKDYVEIGTAHHNAPKIGTLESLIEHFGITQRGIVNYIAVLAESGLFVNIDRKRPSRVKINKNAFR